VRSVALLLTGVALACAAAAPESVPGEPERPLNVLFIAVDDLRPELGCYGVEHARSPRLDAFARTATLFERHYVCAPTCGASRAALLTGQDPERSGRLGNESLYRGARALPREPQDGARTMPELFRRNGYRTVQIGKISHTPDGRVFAYDGSDDGRHELPDAWDELATPYGPWARGWGAFFAYSGGRHREDGEGHRDLFEFTAERDTDLPDGLIAEAAAAKLAEIGARDEPFFLGVGFYKPHLPFVAPRSDLEAMEEVDVPPPPRPEAWDGPYGSRSGEFYGYHAPHGSTRPLGPDATLASRRAYLACVRYVDRQIGVVLDALDDAGLADSTVVVVWGDHGWHLGDSAIWGKHTLLDRSLHSALLLRAPGVSRPGTRTTSVTSTLDLYPTLVDLCALEDRATSAPLDGVSLRPVLDGTAQSVRDAAHSSWRTARTVRTARHRLVARRGDDRRWRDIVLLRDEDGPDPGENLAAGEDGWVESLLLRLSFD
jgi:arylsulfatase A-like enzyme